MAPYKLVIVIVLVTSDLISAARVRSMQKDKTLSVVAGLFIVEHFNLDTSYADTSTFSKS